MPSGIIMQSSSVGATQEAIEKVLTANGFEAEKPEPGAAEAAAEPKREDFESDEAFEQARTDFESKEEEQEEKEAAEAERKRLDALPKKTRRQKAVEKATADLREQNRKLEDRLAALEGKGKKPETAQTAEQLKAPKREDFKTDDEFEEAKFQFRYKTQRAREEEEQRKNSLNSRLEKNFTDYQVSAAAFKEEHDDWDEVVGGEEVRISQPVYYAIIDLGREGPPVAYYLGQNPDETDRLAELTPYRAAIEVGRLADKLKAGSRQTTTDKTAKPAPKRIAEPVRPLSTSATTSSLTSRDAAQNRNYKEFKAAQRRGA